MQRTAVILATLLAVPLLGAAARDQPLSVGTGCFFDIVLTIDLRGKACHAGQNADFAAALTDSISRIKAMYADRGVAAPDIAAIEKRNRRMSAGATCSSDADEFYNAMLQRGPVALRKMTDEIVARPGRPTYGDCL